MHFIISKDQYSSNMSSPLYELKKQASSFLKEKIKTARLALSDVTPVQLMTEEATNETPWPPDTRTIRVVSRAAFEVDDYYRIVEILHKRLLNFNRKNWRGSYKALILLEHLLSHGPLRIAEEFEEDKDFIKEMGRFQYIDEKGFNWGLSVRKLSDRILKLVEDEAFLREERDRARNLTRGIKGFGSVSLQRSSFLDSSLKELSFKTYERCNSDYNDHQRPGHEVFGSNENLLMKEEIKKPQHNDDHDIMSKPVTNLELKYHPFYEDEQQTAESLLSTTK